ncbi:MAG: glycosyltransferase family 39 protein [Candidatus Omnitrophica bacterium]|nr:glycosyltransferase family 39 protein [Candidatus Omnitrophota bacterium]
MENHMIRNQKQFSLLVLLLVIVAGFFLRTQNLNFPSIGYHNMKENENISIAQEMIKTEDFLSKRVYFLNAFDEVKADSQSPRGDASLEQPPLVPYQIVLVWKLLGENVWAPRLFNIMWGLLSIVLIYFLSRILFQDFIPALYAALVLAIMPLAVFFSRNLQAESPAFFFMLLGNLLYARFIVSEKKYNLFLASVALIVAWLYQFSFLIGALPLLFCMPLKRYLRKKKELFVVIALWILPLVLTGGYYAWLIATKQVTFVPVKLFAALTPSYWRESGTMIISYAKDENFTFIYSLLTACGLMLALFKRKGLLNRYLIGWFFSAIIYVILFADNLRQNNFSQMPFTALVCIASTYAVLFIAQEVRKAFKRNVMLIVMAFVLIVSVFPAHRALERMHSTVFLGTDVAGESLKEFTEPQEKIFLLTYAQGNAIARYAQRYMGWPENAEDFKQKEKQYDVRYICIYPPQFLEGLRKNNPQFFEYIQDNYHVKELGILEVSNQVMYFILEKGKDDTRNVKKYLQSFNGQIQPRTIYKIKGKYVFFYTMRPAEGPVPVNENVPESGAKDASPVAGIPVLQSAGVTGAPASQSAGQQAAADTSARKPARNTTLKK